MNGYTELGSCPPGLNGSTVDLNQLSVDSAAFDWRQDIGNDIDETNSFDTDPITLTRHQGGEQGLLLNGFAGVTSSSPFATSLVSATVSSRLSTDSPGRGQSQSGGGSMNQLRPNRLPGLGEGPPMLTGVARQIPGLGSLPGMGQMPGVGLSPGAIGQMSSTRLRSVPGFGSVPGVGTSPSNMIDGPLAGEMDYASTGAPSSSGFDAMPIFSDNLLYDHTGALSCNHFMRR